MRDKPARPTVADVADFLVAVAEALRDGGCAAAGRALDGLDAHAGVLALPRYASHAKHLDALRASLAADDPRGALRNLSRVREHLVPAANDRPFEVRDPVSVVRSRHGWHDGTLTGTVASRHVSPEGTWSYVVRDDEGAEHEVESTRDLRPFR